MFYFVMDINPLEYNNYLDSDIEKIEMCEELSKIATKKYDENIALMILLNVKMPLNIWNMLVLMSVQLPMLYT